MNAGKIPVGGAAVHHLLADPGLLRELFGVEALTIEEWARRVSRSRTSG
jgi:hypothetical protein